MTVIAAIIHEGQVYMGADSLRTTGQSLQIVLDGKIWKEENGMIFGVAGGARTAQVLRYSFSPPPLSEGQDLMAYLCTDFMHSLRAAYEQSGTLHIEDSRQTSNAWVILGWRGRLFSLSSDFCVTETPDGFMTSGSGEDVALGVLSVTLDLPPEQRLTLAMETAERFCEGVRGPFSILNTGGIV